MGTVGKHKQSCLFRDAHRLQALHSTRWPHKQSMVDSNDTCSNVISSKCVLHLLMLVRVEDPPEEFALARVPRRSHPFAQRLWQVVLRVNCQARCDPSACGKRCSKEEGLPKHPPDMRCAKGYPFQQKSTRNSTHKCDEWCPQLGGGGCFRLDNQHDYTRLRLEDARVSPYHPITLAAYPTHGNDQVVTKASSAAYLVKHAAKVEPQGKVSNLLDTVEDSQLPRERPLQGGLQPVDQKQLPYVWGRNIALSEATLVLSGQAMCLKYRIYRYLDTRLPHLRRVVLKRGNEGQAGNDQGGVVDGMVEKYCKHPKGLVTIGEDDNVTDDDVDLDTIGYGKWRRETANACPNAAPSTTTTRKA